MVHYYKFNNKKLSYFVDNFSYNFNNDLKHINFPRKKNFFIIGSAHNYQEIKIKEKQGCEEIFISPIFFNKKMVKISLNSYFL